MQNLGHLPHQGGQPTGHGDMVCLDVLKKPPKLNELHQLITVVSGVDPPGLRFRQRRHVQLQVLLHSSSLALFSPNILSKSRTYLPRAVCSAILSRYSYRAASALGRSSSREAIT
jgi:hypothetical protein